MSYFNGFSTKNYESQGGTFGIYDVACIEEDLRNEIFTIRGERVNMPTFGTRIPLLVFEPNDVPTMDVIREDITRVVGNDPRVKLQSLQVTQVQNSYTILAVATITYLFFNVTTELNIQVTSR